MSRPNTKQRGTTIGQRQQKKLIRLISAFSDMAQSLEAANSLVRGVQDKLYGHLFLSMVVAYARPFTENRGVGRIQFDYPRYPDFGDSDMPARHSRLLDLRNKFLAHSSAEGTRVIIIPPGAPNPLGRPTQPNFTFIMGKRTFADTQYVEWLRAAPEAFSQRLYSDIHQLLEQSFAAQAGLTSPFELPTGHENFQWT
jgi:hypothetical protein